MKKKLHMFVMTTLLLTGCASNLMIDRTNQATVVPATDKVQIILMRPSSFGGAVQSPVFDVSSGDAEFIGIVSAGTQISYMVDPGKRVFMVVSEAADFLEADLEKGKTYYAIVTARMGAWRSRFSLYPIRNGAAGDRQYDSEEFREWSEKVRFVENTPESIAWFEANKADIREKQIRYWEVWQQKSAADLAERTLHPDDGV